MTMGRPPKITVEWADKQAETLAVMFKNGESLAEVCVELDICKDSFYKAAEISADFSDSYKRGREYSEAWWTKLGRAGAAGKVDIQPTTWIFNMKNRHGWKDKTESTVTIDATDAFLEAIEPTTGLPSDRDNGSC